MPLDNRYSNLEMILINFVNSNPLLTFEKYLTKRNLKYKNYENGS